MKIILLIIIVLSNFLSADFTRDANGIVSDSRTGLAWQDDYTDNGNAIKKTIWTDALAYCEALSLGGHSDWRLPNANELYSIGDRSRFTPAMDATFSNVISSDYWSSTTAVYISSAWVVSFFDGNDYYIYKTGSSYVRCVRDR